jgi:hypothetical protein
MDANPVTGLCGFDRSRMRGRELQTLIQAHRFCRQSHSSS